MAKAEGFKNKITKAQEELFKAIDTEKAKKKALSEKIVQELSKQDKANVRTLNALNKEYLEECNNNKEKLQMFADTINQLNEELTQTVEDYNKYREEHDELAILTEKNEEAKATAKNKFKREIQDINIKIDKIDKELKETLETRSEDFNEELTTYKSKIIEFDKKKRFEVTKIQNNTIKEYDELQKLLLQENKKSEIKSINKKIKQIRLAGLMEEKECVFRHLAEQKQFELDFAKYEYEYKCQNINLEKEFNTRIEETKFDRSVTEYNFKKNCISSDNEVVHNFNENDKQLKLDHNAKVEDLHKVINDRTLEQLAFEYEKADSEANVTKNIYQSIENSENKQAAKLIDFANKELVLINKDVTLFQKNLNMTATFYVQNIIALYTNYFKKFIQKEEIFVNTLLVNNVKGAFLQGNTYDEYAAQIKEIFETFRNNEEEFLETFSTYVTISLNNLIDQIETFAKTINALNDNINEIMVNYHDSISKVLNSASENGFVFVEAIKNKAKEEVGAKEYDNKELFAQRNQITSKEKESVMVEFEEREKAIKEIEENQAIEFNLEYQDLEKAKKDAIQEIENKAASEISGFTGEYEAKVKGIVIRFDEENKAVEKQYKQKMVLL